MDYPRRNGMGNECLLDADGDHNIHPMDKCWYYLAPLLPLLYFLVIIVLLTWGIEG